MYFSIASICTRLLASSPTAHRNSGLVHRFGRTGHERVPPGEPTSLGQPSIGAGAWQPADLAQFGRRDHNAIGHTRMPICVVAALARADVEKVASDLGDIDRAGVLLLDLEQAALPAAVAEGLPLVRRHLLQAFGHPERFRIRQRCRLAIARVVGIGHRNCKFRSGAGKRVAAPARAGVDDNVEPLVGSIALRSGDWAKTATS